MSIESSKPGKSVYVKMGVWWDEDQGHIHLTAPGVHGFHTTVSPNPKSKRGHPNLFMKLARALREGGAPYPPIEEGEEELDPQGPLALRIIECVAKQPGLTEAQLAEALFGEDGYQQRVNSTCRLMIGRGKLERKGTGGKSDPFTYHLPRA